MLICCDVVEIVLVGNIINDYGNIEPVLCNKSKFVTFLAVMSFYDYHPHVTCDIHVGEYLPQHFH